MTLPKTIEIYADTRGSRECRACGEKIVFAEVVASGKYMPFDAPAIALKTRNDGGNRLIEAVDIEDNHWKTCTKPEQFRRG